MAYFYQQNLNSSKVNNFYFAWDACRSTGEAQVAEEHWRHIVDDAVSMGGLPYVNSVHIVKSTPPDSPSMKPQKRRSSIFRTPSSLQRALYEISSEDITTVEEL